MIPWDAFRLQNYAVGLGAGKRLYPSDTYPKLGLIMSWPCPTGVVLLCYEPAA
jgi:hypothetical protein